MTTRTINVHKDEETGEVSRRSEWCVSRREVAFQCAANDPLPSKDSPMLLRYIVYDMNVARTSSGTTINKTMLAP